MENAINLVATLIADPSKRGLSDDEIWLVRNFLEEEFHTTKDPDWLKLGVACDIKFQGPSLNDVRAVAHQKFRGQSFDLIIQPTDGRKKMLLLADMDSTIIQGETLDELANLADLKNEVAGITSRAMRGEIEFQDALKQRVKMLKGLPTDCLEEVFKNISLNPGAKTLVQTMRLNGALTVLVSGGFKFFTSRIADQLGFNEEHANDLIVEGGKLTGEVKEPILDKNAKLDLLQNYASAQGLCISSSIAIGDGANDLPMIKRAGLGVAYHAKPIVQEDAAAVINFGDLTAALYLQGYNFCNFT